MLSNREKRIIEAEGEIEFIEETLYDLFYKEEPLDEFESELMRAALEQLEVIKSEVKRLKKGT